MQFETGMQAFEPAGQARGEPCRYDRFVGQTPSFRSCREGETRVMKRALTGMGIAMGAAMLALSPAQGALLKYSYTMKGGAVMTGSLLGSVGDDGNIFNVTGSRDFTFNGNRLFNGNGLPPGLEARSIDALLYGRSEAASVALDKSRLDLVMIRGSGAGSSYPLTFGVGNVMASAYGEDVVLSDLVYGGNLASERFDPASLSLRQYRDATLDFGYTLASTGAALSGTLSGWISDDGSLFEVGDVRSASVNGLAIPGTLRVDGTDRYTFGYREAPASVRLDRSLVDFTILTGAGEQIGFGVGNNLTLGYGMDVVSASRSLGGTGGWEPFRPGNLSLRLDGVAVPVPEPSSWAMMLAGFWLVGSVVRRRARVQLA